MKTPEAIASGGLVRLRGSGRLRDRRGSLCSFLNHVFEHLRGQGLGALDRHAESARPNVIGGDAKRAPDTEEDGVEVEIADAIVVLERAAERIDIRGGILGLALLLEHLRNDIED